MSAMTVSRSEAARLARPGRNCSVVARAGRMGLAVDADAYYRALAHALRRARRSILIVGWEFDSRTDLIRDPSGRRGEPVGPLLDRVVRERPGLSAHVLIWDTALLYAIHRESLGLVRMNWLTPRRLHFRLDDSHPLGASHHQKIVVIDDALAFVGGLDLSSQRWDSRAHAPADPRRTDPGAGAYPPFHDMMAVVTGEAARALADICRDRWRTAAGWTPKPVPAGDPDELWPPGIEPLLTGVEVALARTSPAWDGRADLREVETLYVDMIAAARRFIYVENQYFASRRIARAIEGRLTKGDCPEIVVINPGEPASLVERSTMGVARARLYRRLMEIDGGRRLRIYYPLSGGREVKIHAKLMIVDDHMLRVGSANLNNRSMGLDSECDLLLEAAGDSRVADGVRLVRLDLLAEHLGVDAGTVAAAERAAGGMHAAIATLAGGDRTLVELGPVDPSTVVEMIADSGIPDPEEPVETLVWIEEALPEPAKRPLQVRIWALAGLLAALAAAGILWRWAPPELWGVVAPWAARLAEARDTPATAAMVVLLFVAGGLARVPVSLMVLAAGAVLGIVDGTVQALAGALSSAALMFGLGRVLGRARVRRLAGWKVNRVQRALRRHGVMAILLLRLMPVAAFSVINLVAGATGVRLRDFVIGTALGMLPGVFAMSVVGDRLVAVLRSPSLVNITVLAAAATVAIAAVFGLVERLARARARGARPPQEA